MDFKKAKRSSLNHIRQMIALDEASLKALSTKSPLRVISYLLLDFSIILFCAWLCELNFSPFMYLFILLIVGTRLIGIATYILHDGVHGLLFNSKNANHLFAKNLYWLFLGPIFIRYETFKTIHLAHHQHVNNKDDPDLRIIELTYGCSNLTFILLLLSLLSGFGFLTFFVSYLYVEIKKRNIFILPQVVIITSVVAGFFANAYIATLLFKYWLIPLVTWGYTLVILRATAEHYPPEFSFTNDTRPKIFYTRDVLVSFVDKLFFLSRGVNFHLTHHLYPEVPFHRLSSLQKLLAKNNVYQSHAHITHGYIRFLREYFSKQRTRNSYLSFNFLKALTHEILARK